MDAPRRLACLVVPLFPLAARLRSEPELTREAVGVFTGNGNGARLAAATRPARRAGLEPGITLAQARSLLPRLLARPRDAECERSAREALLEAAESISPTVEEGEEGVVYVDLAGLERHFRGDSFERQAGTALERAAEAVGLPVKVGIAGSKLAARVAAGCPGSPTVVPAGEEAEFLAALPLDRLSPELKVAQALGRWGIHSAGELAALPAAEVSSRLGKAGEELHTVARGIDPRPLTPRRLPPTFEEGMSLEWPLVALEPFLFVARTACERLCKRLESQGLAARRLELSMRLEPDGHHDRGIDLPAPSRDHRTLLTLIRLELEARPPGAPVAGFTLKAYPDRPREAQLSLFGPAALSPDQLAATLARLFALLGPERVGAPAAVDGHKPERFGLVDYAPPPPPKVRREPRQGRGLLTVRVLRPPVPLEVTASGDAVQDGDGGGPQADPCALPEPPAELARLRLLSIASRQEEADDDTADGGGHRGGGHGGSAHGGSGHRGNGHRGNGHRGGHNGGGRNGGGRNGGGPSQRHPKIRGRVRVASGPWGIEEEWWSESPTVRDYWDVELAGGALYRIYRERASGEWYADGIYD